MKKLAVVLVIAAIALSAVPVFAADAAASKDAGKSFFQIAADEINSSKMPERFAVKPVAKDAANAASYIGSTKVSIFQDTARSIKEQSAAAKAESVR